MERREEDKRKIEEYQKHPMTNFADSYISSQKSIAI